MMSGCQGLEVVVRVLMDMEFPFGMMKIFFSDDYTTLNIPQSIYF